MHMQQVKTMLQVDAETLRTFSNETIAEMLAAAHEHITNLEARTEELAKNAKKLVLG